MTRRLAPLFLLLALAACSLADSGWVVPPPVPPADDDDSTAADDDDAVANDDDSAVADDDDSSVPVDDDDSSAGDDDSAAADDDDSAVQDDDDSAASDDDDSTPPGAVDVDNDGYTPLVDCDDANADVNPGATEVCNGIDDDCDGSVDEEQDCDGDEPEPDLQITITTPGALEYGSMICHVEYVDDSDNDGSLTDEFWGWEYSWVENWVSQTTLESDPGIIDAVRLNCTLCPDELTVAEEPSSPEAEAMGCTWTAVNGSSSTNGAVATWYFDETFSSEAIAVVGGSSVLVDLR